MILQEFHKFALFATTEGKKSMEDIKNNFGSAFLS
jgi:hypothetical protein